MIPQNDFSVEGFQHAKSRCWKLSPSDFGFLFAECKACAYRKIVQGRPRPSGPFPSVFKHIDETMKRAYRENGIVLPDGMYGRVVFEDEWVRSQPIKVPHGMFYLTGKLDTVLRLEDGSFALIDFKTAIPGSEHLIHYERQLNSYAIAMENAAQGVISLACVTRLALVVYSPFEFDLHEDGKHASLNGSVQWVEIERDDDAFLNYIDSVVAVLEQPTVPPSSPACCWCKYRSAA